jgi:hypothetical protein
MVWDTDPGRVLAADEPAWAACDPPEVMKIVVWGWRCADRVDAYWEFPDDEPDPGCCSEPEIEPSSCVEQHIKPRQRLRTQKGEEMIAAVVERCAGIDVGKKFLKVCVMTGPLSEEPKFEIRRVECTQCGYEQLLQWLQSEGVTKVVMESTGPYWVPVFNVLEATMGGCGEFWR